jgi:alpha-L-fucosidase
MSSDALVDLLIEKVASGGNLLLDVGPTADGRIPVIQQQRLLDMGSWLNINGEAIYETRKWEGAKKNKTENVFFTTREKDLYVLCTEFPAEPLVVEGIRKSGKVTMLGVDAKINAKKSGKKITITIPELSPLTNPGQFAWVFKIENGL